MFRTSNDNSTGAYGTVWKGQWGSQLVAIEVLKRVVDEDDPDGMAEFNKECETLQTIKNPCLLMFLGAGTNDDGQAYMVTEFMNSGSLRTVLLDKSRPLEWDVRIRVATQIARGMQHLHKLKIVHRDIKSDNVLLDDKCNAKVCDFGKSWHGGIGRTTGCGCDGD
eukprot:m.76045 g.76045  ORF g.76045 m.76045 type:complete len:165 (-) comp10481_c0_seq1:619-1113(-)